MKEKIDKEILARYINGESSAEDKAYIQNVFSNEKYQGELKKLLRLDWEQSVEETELPEKDLNHILHKLYYKINKDQQQEGKSIMMNFWEGYSKIAAIILIPFLLGVGLYGLLDKEKLDAEVSYAEIIAPLGSRINFTLPDGSTGWLNSGSKLKYPVQFANTRDVELKGEAFFDIKKNKDKPFNVKAAKINISVLGTQFNVSAYQDDQQVDVVLEEGKVVLNKIGSDEIVEMEPDERVVYDEKKKTLEKSKVNSEKYSSWREGKLVFRNDPIEVVAKRLSRWYNVEIILDENIKADFGLRATFIDEEIEEVLKLIKLTFPIEYEIAEREKDEDGNFRKRKINIRPVTK